MPNPIFLTGGSGFVGSAVIRQLLTRSYPVQALTNRQPLSVSDPRLQTIHADLFSPSSLSEAMAGCGVVIHLVGIIAENPAAGVTFDRMHFQATRSMVDAATASGVKRFIQMSALGSRPNAASEYHKTKFKAEEYLQASGLDWTILRPSMIHGPDGQFMKMEAAWARKKAMPFLFMPYFGSGVLGLGRAGMLQPVDVADVARAFVDAIEKPQTIHQTYALAGAEELTWPQMHTAAAKAIVGKRRATFGIPAWYAKTLTALLPRRWLPFNRDQVIMSQEDNTASESEQSAFEQDFGWQPRGFSTALAEYAARL